MEIFDILSSKSNPHSVTCFTSEAFSPLFFSFYIELLKKRFDNVQVLPIETASSVQTQAQLETTFLGSTTLYFLRGLDSLASRQMSEWLTYLHDYSGPNKLLFFVPSGALKKKPKNWQTIAVPAVIDKKVFLKMLAYVDVRADEFFVKQLFSSVDKLSLEQSIIFIFYASLVGKNCALFFETWLDELIVPEASLFQFSQAFFAKDKSKFFGSWSIMHEKFVAQFWVSFWSEQLWRASAYVQLMHLGKRLEAKKIGYRLPFSFLQRDWRRYTSHELAKAHQFIYDIDYKLKHNANEIAFDLFYLKFLGGYFCSGSASS